MPRPPSPVAAAFQNAFVSEVEKLALGLVPPAPDPLKGAPMPYLASEHAEHVTDLGGLGMMGVANASRIQEALTGRSSLSDNQRDLLDLGGLAAMAAPSFKAQRYLKANPGSKAPLAGGGSRGVNLVNLASLGALATPVLDRMQARARGDAEGKRIFSDKTHALLELGGYGGLTGAMLRNKALTPIHDKEEHKLINRALMGYGLLAAPEAAHLLHNEHENHAHPQFDVYGNPIPVPRERPGVVRSLTDMVGLGLLGSAPYNHLRHHGH